MEKENRKSIKYDRQSYRIYLKTIQSINTSNSTV